ncbi:putative homeodomain transcription factor 1 [Cephus cinctus]|uniref:Homeodomain transcription factor 1 n=1 Tax=Cephus cinctus TaxID=211228 RepID=A0AAJ7BSB2_CEPCN|nr:putative homeodomain transcription factor 1 [Cephus cinctus]XP_015593087.1 putative homeodomain transcription factor 1 [Cephus cinctus]
MGLNELVYWYQKKIGTYDKQQWEKTVEQRILGGFTHIPMRTARLKTELIDVDLVRGSSFPKAKPKHGLTTVARLAVQRLLLLPLHSRWWIQQTSPRVFVLFLLLYSLQLLNIGIYFNNIIKESDESNIVSTSEVLIPVFMMLTLCTVHSQIVSTNSGPSMNNVHNNLNVGRSCRGRCHLGKRPRRKLRVNDESKSSQDTASEKASSVSGDVPPSVRFAKKVTIESSSVLGSRQRNHNVQQKPGGVVQGDDGSSANAMSPVDVSAGEEKSDNVVEENSNKPVVVHQDDDGFESLNGNVSSDNDRVTAAIVATTAIAATPTTSATTIVADTATSTTIITTTTATATDTTTTATTTTPTTTTTTTGGASRSPVDEHNEDNNTDRATRHEKHSSWLDELKNEESSSKFSAPVALRKSGNYSDSEGDARNGSDCEGSANAAVLDRGTAGNEVDMVGVSTSNTRKLCESEEEGECEDAAIHHLTEATTSATEWMGVTTNSDECSYSSELEESESHSEGNINTEFVEHPFSWEFELPPSILLSQSCAPSDRVSCTIWTRRDIMKAELSVLDISSAIIARVESMPESMDYFYGGLLLSLILTLIPSMRRLSDHFGSDAVSNVTSTFIYGDLLTQAGLDTYTDALCRIMDAAVGKTLWERTIVLVSAFERLTLSCILFFLLAVAERTFKQRLLYAKLFSHLTSSRRARKSDLPHFRLNKVRNIKTWLSVRSYLKRRGPQRSVDVIVSAVFIVTLILLSFVSLELIKDLESLHSRYNIEALFWSFALGIFILRFMTLGTKINKKYRNLSVLITEQINLYLQIEQKPHKKEELMVANCVLKLAADLLKELESPFKISGLSANPYLYTITKVVLLSALSGVLSELLGFKLKLHKIKIK